MIDDTDAAFERQIATDDDQVQVQRLRQIERARADLAAAYAAHPDQVDRFEGRMAALAAARKRARARVDELVLGAARQRPDLTRPAGMSKLAWKAERARRIAAHKRLPPTLAEKWMGKQGTPETLEHASSTHQGALAQLHLNGTINAEQLEWAAEIANVYRSIQADVAVAVASLEARVDQGRRLTGAIEGIRRVRLHHAYTLWREALPAPKQMILDMIVGDAIGYTVAAKLYRVHNRRAKRLLLEALAAWPFHVTAAHRAVPKERLTCAR